MSELRSYTIAALGAETPLSQIKRIREGLVVAGGDRVTLIHGKPDDWIHADVIYVNDPSFFKSILFAKEQRLLKSNVKLIFNVLDIPEHLFPPNGSYGDIDLRSLAAQLEQADIVTIISHWTNQRLNHYFGIEGVVIGNPINDVSPTKRLAGRRPFPYKVLMAGRLNDPNKRIHSIGIPALIMAGFDESEVAVIGGEYPGWGTNLGVVDVETLSDLYNSVDFLMFPSRIEGLGLPILEAIVCGAIPLVCDDLTTLTDIRLDDRFSCYPSPWGMAMYIKRLTRDKDYQTKVRDMLLHMGNIDVYPTFNKYAVAEKIIQMADGYGPFHFNS